MRFYDKPSDCTYLEVRSANFPFMRVIPENQYSTGCQFWNDLWVLFVTMNCKFTRLMIIGFVNPIINKKEI